MGLKQQIDADLKTAMLAGDKVLVTTLRGLKSVVLYAEVAAGSREKGLEDETIVQLLTKESKKRQESADLYERGGDHEKSVAELAEKRVISQYLPQQLTDRELDEIISMVLAQFDTVDNRVMGQVIGSVKQKAGATVDGGRVAEAVKRRITS